MEIVPRTGNFQTKGDLGIANSVKFEMPESVKSSGKNCGNSGMIWLIRCESQVLDSYENPLYMDESNVAIYGQYSPLVNGSRPQGEWQTLHLF